MQIENQNGLTKLIAEENKYITTVLPPGENEELMLAKIVYLGKYDTVENYKEVGESEFPIKLGDKLKELENTNKAQDEMIDICLLATDEMYMMIEPLISVNTLNNVGGSKMVDMYVAMVIRGLKTIEEVPVRYREEVRKILEALEK